MARNERIQAVHQPRNPGMKNRRQLWAALKTIPLLQDLAPASLDIQRLPGLSNRNYRLRGNRADGIRVDYVLRLPGLGSERYIDRSGEIHNRQQAAQLGLTSGLVYADRHSGAQLSEYLPGRSLQHSDLQQAGWWRGAVRLLRRLHQSDAVFQGGWPLFDTLADYLRWAPPYWRSELADPVADMEQLRPELERNAQAFCACHCDPTPGNFYCQPDGRLWLLDWEYSAQAEPAWDLAGLVAEAELDSIQQAQAVRCYAGRVDTDLQRRVDLYLACLHTLAAAWGAAQVGLGNHPQVALAGYIQHRLQLACSQFKCLRVRARSIARM